MNWPKFFSPCWSKSTFQIRMKIIISLMWNQGTGALNFFNNINICMSWNHHHRRNRRTWSNSLITGLWDPLEFEFRNFYPRQHLPIVDVQFTNIMKYSIHISINMFSNFTSAIWFTINYSFPNFALILLIWPADHSLFTLTSEIIRGYPNIWYNSLLYLVHHSDFFWNDPWLFVRIFLRISAFEKCHILSITKSYSI